MSGKFVGTVVPGQGLIGAVLLKYLDPGYRGAGFVGYLAADGGSPFFCFSQAVENPSSVSNRKDRRFLMRFFMAGAGLWLLPEI